MTGKHADVQGYCDSLYNELNSIRNRLGEFKGQIEQMQGKDKNTLESHLKHIDEIMEVVSWKMEIFSKSCPVDWNKFGVEGESTVSVQPTESGEVAGGNIGG